MVKLVVLGSIIVTAIFSSQTKSENCDISGIWYHTTKPAKLLIDLSKGEISVHSHEINSESIGLVVIKNLKLESNATYWNGKMYSATEDSFVVVKITPQSCNLLNVSFRGESILRLER